jgi:hypothetical protein
MQFRLPLALFCFLAPISQSRLAAEPCIHPGSNEEFPLFGDINGSGEVDVADALCVLLASLWQLTPSAAVPACVADDLDFADLTCDAEVDVSDSLLTITLALQGSIAPGLDSLSRGCPDACVGPLDVTPASPIVQTGASVTLVASGGLPPRTFALTDGGGSVGPTGVFSAPSTPGTSTVVVADAANRSQTIEIIVHAPLQMSPSSASLSSGSSLTFTTIGGVPPYTYGVVSGGGTFVANTFMPPTVSGAVLVRVTDSVGNTAQASIVVDAGVNLTISTSQSNVILSSLASISSPAAVTVTIAPGVVISSSSPGTPALATGVFPAGSVLTIINQGTIRGAGGSGGMGGGSGSVGGFSFNANTIGSPGGAGGAAIRLDWPASINNASGTIAGGGGGGGGGGSGWKDFDCWLGGGGGGGGAHGGSGGPPGNGMCRVASVGQPGTTSSFGAGGAGGIWGPDLRAGAGGNGGAPGQPGQPGAKGQKQYGDPGNGNYNGGAGGAAGAAVITQGNSLSWISGGSAPNVLGPVQ